MARSRCARCGDAYSGVTAFDMHLREGGLVHLPPDQVPGLRQRPDGVWAHAGRMALDAVSARSGRPQDRFQSPGVVPATPRAPRPAESRTAALDIP